MKTTISVLIASLLVCAASFAKPLPQTNLNKVYGAGGSGYVEGQPFALKPGIYKVGDEDSQLNGDSFLMVDRYINDDSRVLAILVNQNNLRGKNTSAGRFYIGKKIKNGTSLMLSPIFIDVNGNLAVEAELNEKAPVIEISLRNDSSDFRYPYMLQGHNGALGGRLMGMRAVSDERIKFTTWPSNNVFEGTCDSSKIVVSGSTVAIHRDSHFQDRLELVPLNGNGGKFAAMVRTELNTMGEYMVSDSSVSRLAFFIKNDNGEENFIVASPSTEVGLYKFEYYGPQFRTFLDRWFPGKR